MTAKTQRHIAAERWAKVASATSNQQRDYVVEAVSQMLKDREAARRARGRRVPITNPDQRPRSE
jgi:hypothetical protein